MLTRRRGLDAPDLNAKTATVVAAALQLGWVALEEFLFHIADVRAGEQDQIRTRARHIAAALSTPRHNWLRRRPRNAQHQTVKRFRACAASE